MLRRRGTSSAGDGRCSVATLREAKEHASTALKALLALQEQHTALDSASRAHVADLSQEVRARDELLRQQQASIARLQARERELEAKLSCAGQQQVQSAAAEGSGSRAAPPREPHQRPPAVPASTQTDGSPFCYSPAAAPTCGAVATTLPADPKAAISDAPSQSQELVALQAQVQELRAQLQAAQHATDAAASSSATSQTDLRILTRKYEALMADKLHLEEHLQVGFVMWVRKLGAVLEGGTQLQRDAMAAGAGRGGGGEAGEGRHGGDKPDPCGGVARAMRGAAGDRSASAPAGSPARLLTAGGGLRGGGVRRPGQEREREGSCWEVLAGPAVAQGGRPSPPPYPSPER